MQAFSCVSGRRRSHNADDSPPPFLLLSFQSTGDEDADPHEERYSLSIADIPLEYLGGDVFSLDRSHQDHAGGALDLLGLPRYAPAPRGSEGRNAATRGTRTRLDHCHPLV